MNDSAGIEVIDVTDAASFERIPPCADPRFDHRTCDYWEDEVRGSKEARPSWLRAPSQWQRPRPQPASGNPFAPPARDADTFNPFDPASAGGSATAFNPFAPEPETQPSPAKENAPTKLRLLDRGQAVFGSYAKVLVLDGEPAVYAQFGPLSAYPRAQQVRDLYPALPSSPLPAVITCVATIPAARDRDLGRTLVDAVAADLEARGFSAVEAYPDLTLAADEASAATPSFWERCGFSMAAPDERFPVMRLELG